LGTTVKVLVPPTARPPLIKVLLNVKELELAPERAMLKAPVAWFPVLLIVTLFAVCAPYPAAAAGKVYVVVWLRLTP
jgi:hypothetical protein